MSKHIARLANTWVRCNLLHSLVDNRQAAHHLWAGRRLHACQQGFSLLEVIVAIAAVGLLIAPLMCMFTGGSKAAEDALARVAALYDAQQFEEAVKGAPYYRVGNPRGSTDSSITLGSDTDAANLAGELIAITGGSGKGQIRSIASYDSASQIAFIEVGDPWDDGQQPDTASTYLICDDGFQGMGVARGGQSRAIDLSEDNSSDDLYNGYYVTIAGGTGSGQTRRVMDYNGITAPQNTAFLDRDWDTVPDGFSLYRLYRYDYEINSTTSGHGWKTVVVTVFYKNGAGMQAVSLTTDRRDDD